MLLNAADRWSRVGITVGMVLFIVLLVADVSIWAADGVPALAQQFHSLAVLTIAIVVLGSVAVQATVCSMRGQRRAVEEITTAQRQIVDAVAELHELIGREGAVNGKVVELGSRLADKITRP